MVVNIYTDYFVYTLVSQISGQVRICCRASLGDNLGYPLRIKLRYSFARHIIHLLTAVFFACKHRVVLPVSVVLA